MVESLFKGVFFHQRKDEKARIHLNGGADESRTRDLRRDRPAF